MVKKVGPGHNNPPAEEVADEVDNGETIVASQLRNYIERVENLEEEKKELADMVREVYAEAKAHGFDPKIMRKVVQIRKQDKAEREEQQAQLDLYLEALGESHL